MTVAGSTGALKGNGVNTTFSAILKEFYRPGVQDLLNSKTVLSRMLQRRSEGIEGKYIVLDLNTNRNFGYGYIAEGGQLPDPGTQSFQQARYSTRYSYGRIKFSGPSASASRSDRGSFVRIMDAEIQGMARDIQHNDNRVLFGDGSGRLARIPSHTASTTVTVDYPGGVASTALGTQYLAPGMRVALGPGTSADAGATMATTAPATLWDAATTQAATISTVDYTSGTFTVAANLNSTTGTQYLYTASATTGLGAGDYSRGKEPFGLAAIIDDGNPPFCDGTANNWATGLGEINATTTQVWRAGVIDNGGSPIAFAPDMLQQAMDLADINGDGTIGAFVTTHGIRRQYLNSLVAAKRYPNTMEMDGGFKVLTYDGRPIVVDKDCTRGRIYCLDLETLFMCYETDYDWIDQDGSVLHRIPDQDAFQATMYRYWQFCTNARNRNVVIKDILDT